MGHADGVLASCPSSNLITINNNNNIIIISAAIKGRQKCYRHRTFRKLMLNLLRSSPYRH